MVLLLAFGCSDYGLHKPDVDGTCAECAPWEDSGTRPPDPTTPDATTPTEPGDCAPETFAAEKAEIDESCHTDAHVGTFTPVVEWTKTSWSEDSQSNQVMMMPAVASLTDDNGDGLIDQNDVPDIIVVTYGAINSGSLRAVSGDDGSELWNATLQGIQMTGAVAVGDIDGDGLVEIVAPTWSTLRAYGHDGTFLWQSPELVGHMDGISDAPAIADMDGDGTPEIVVGNAILSSTGVILGEGEYGIGSTSNVGTASVPVDLDGDGNQELVTGNAAYDIDGEAVWYNGEDDGYVAIADIDGDGEGDVIVAGDAGLRVQDDAGNVLCRTKIPDADSSAGGPPTIADFNGDGEPEIGVAATSTYAVFDTDCNLLWQSDTEDASSGNTGSSVFDFEGDGVAEVVYADETRLWVFNGPDGSVKLESTDHTSGTWTEYPVVADVDGDDQAEIVVPNTLLDGGYSGITVIGDADHSWQAGRRIWNQHAYSITNVNDDGTIPAHPVPNWDSYNNFRSGDLTGLHGADLPDLVVRIDDVCADDADGGTLHVWGRVGNRGTAAVDPGVVVDLYADRGAGLELLASEPVGDAVPSGQYLPSFEIQVAPIDASTIVRLVVHVDRGNADTGEVAECNEKDDEAIWDEPIAP